MKPSESFGQKSHAEMSGDAAVELLQLFAQNGIDVVVDGGWGVDALLDEQTRSHEDLDIALQHKDVPKLRALLEARGYNDVPRDDTWECNFVMGDNQGHEVDIHSYTFDAYGRNVFGVEYPLDSLTGSGFIQGYPVRCISVEWMVKFHSGYKLDENDYRDVSALCERFSIALPTEYERFTHQSSD
jgi:lincosamide nucleotidyltransferase A/C/D/E